MFSLCNIFIVFIVGRGRKEGGREGERGGEVHVKEDLWDFFWQAISRTLNRVRKGK